MSPKISNSLPLPSFSPGDDTSPTVLLEYLQELTKTTDEKPPFTSNESEELQESSWYTLLEGLTIHFLTSFQAPGELAWTALQEKLQLVESALSLVQRATTRIGYPYADRPGFAQTVVMRLANFCITMDLWIDVEESSNTAEQLFADAQTSSVLILRYLGGDGRMRSSASDSRRVFKRILATCIAVCYGNCSVF